MIQPLHLAKGEGTLEAGGVFKLNAGDVITLTAGSTVKIYMWSFHTYFGAFLI